MTVRDLRLDGGTYDHRRIVPLLEQTFQAVRRVRNQANLRFSVPALPTRFGALMVPLGTTFALYVYNWLDVEPAQNEDGIVAAGLGISASQRLAPASYFGCGRGLPNPAPRCARSSAVGPEPAVGRQGPSVSRRASSW